MAISKLSDDLIIEIAKQLKQTADNNQSLYAFIQVCQRWNRYGLPMFYGNIAISNETLQPFTRSFNAAAHGPSVRSLTLHIKQDLGIPPQLRASNPLLFPKKADEPDSIENSLPERVAEFVTLIPHFSNLSSFSLKMDLSSSRSVPRATLIKLLEALPASCTHLELDTNAQDHREEGEDAHVCDAIRDVLPRMQNARIRISAMCCKMFGTKDTALDEFTPLQLPNLKSLVLNCAIASGLQVQSCGGLDWTGQAKGPDAGVELAWRQVTSSLMNLVAHDTEGNLADACIYALNATLIADVTQTTIRANLVTQETSAFPILRLSRPFQDPSYYSVRMLDGSAQVVNLSSQIESLVEGHIWRDIRGGSRLPTVLSKAGRTVLPSFAWGCAVVPLPGQTEEEWIAENKSKGLPSFLWDEEKVGRQIMRAEIRTGDRFLGVVPIKLDIPEGWVIAHGRLISAPD
ncbi:unnamed protein product [Periconia digitata]|uniref:Uncharacterized protein n=1 Tax=Periconia digitata TaxID=1303443 RepID=A0A9W4U895_9PLEO|nr:unnamed protein product [Periconia digitata]